MGMQCHFHIADIPEIHRIHRHADSNQYDENDPSKGFFIDYYIVVDPESLYFNTDEKYENAWLDIGSASAQQMHVLKWLVQNRICFTCS